MRKMIQSLLGLFLLVCVVAVTFVYKTQHLSPLTRDEHRGRFHHFDPNFDH